MEDKMVRMEEGLHHQIHIEAVKRRKTLKALIDEIVREWLEKHGSNTAFI